MQNIFLACFFLLHLCFAVGFNFTFEVTEEQKREFDLKVAQAIEIHPLRKCRCDAAKVWQNGACRATKDEFQPIIGHFIDLQERRVNASDFSAVIVGEPNCGKNVPSFVIKNVILTTEGSLFHKESGATFQNAYCLVDHIIGNTSALAEARVCLNSFSVPLCCPHNSRFDNESLTCISDKSFQTLSSPPVYIGSTLINTTNKDVITTILQNFPLNCQKSFYRKKQIDWDDGVTLSLQDGTLYLIEYAGEPLNSFPLNFNDPFCIIPEDDSFSFLRWTNETTCIDSNESCERVMTHLLVALLLLSTIFLLIILILHAVMPKLRKSLGNKITVCHIASLFVAFCILLCIHIPSVYENINCKVYGPLFQLAFLSTFFWLNVMCFDLWWKLQCSTAAGETIQSARSKFFWYSLYAWGCPILITAITIVLDNVTQLQGAPGIIIPGFNKNNNCWFGDKKAALLYYFGVIAVLMSANVFFFVWVLVVLFKANCVYHRVLQDSQQSRDRVWIYLKIFGVMGITWIFEVISYLEGTCKYWVFFDVLNVLRGPILFVIFFGNKKFYNKLKPKLATFNQTVTTKVNRSVNSLRKLSLKPSYGSGSNSPTSDTSLEIRRNSETHTDISHKNQQNTGNENA